MKCKQEPPSLPGRSKTIIREIKQIAQRSIPRVFLDLLPAKFTLVDAKRVRQQQGLSPERASRLSSPTTWLRRKAEGQPQESGVLREVKTKEDVPILTHPLPCCQGT